MRFIHDLYMTHLHRAGVRLSFFTSILFVFLVLLNLPLVTTLRAQQGHAPKVPGLDRIITPGPSRQAFTGVVKSVDMKTEVLNVDAVTGNGTEIFPLKKKKVHVVTADGDKLKLERLKPGTNVLVYYEQSGDRKTVTDIVVLTASSTKKKTPPM
jgi:Cu/Ag efflux protein CusF